MIKYFASNHAIAGIIQVKNLDIDRLNNRFLLKVFAIGLKDWYLNIFIRYSLHPDNGIF